MVEPGTCFAIRDFVTARAQSQCTLALEEDAVVKSTLARCDFAMGWKTSQ